MASIQKTKNGTWQVRYKDPSGRHRAKTYRLKADAQKFLHSVETEIARGSYIAAERGAVDVPGWLQRHLDSRSDLGVTTRNRTQGIINTHVRPKWASIKLSDVDHAAVALWAKQLMDSGQSVRSAKKIINVMSAAFEAAVRDRRVHGNPCQGVRFPKPTPKPKIFLTPRQVEELAGATFDDRQALVVYTLAYCGLRWGELAGLRVRDFDPLRRRLNVEQTIVDDNGRMIEKPPKDHEIRSVPVPKFLVEKIAAYIAGAGAADPIFASPRGGPLRNRNERNRWFDRAVKDIGLPELTPHGLRHTAASMAISAGASVLSVQRMLGHSSATVTLDVYSALFENDLDEVADRLDRVRTETGLRDSYAEVNVRELG
ncbi:MAG: site-specific integrase [Brevibacterium sp.]|uniref:tyrosine-type recombinase/integrase n=1 Tax=Brevibacterium sp. TaxID=1701 RepID=UPI002648B602|nr:site-specific integrase [Brevibacterium sp.]MDN5808376.1 site-specific integrase [Brevibacterium sp.]MDN5834061.1 site-specific integrase [Brevibacterium sp.]MDN5876498.1 site-specific integrase [Brevibacterium sp.]MDN5908667.1 site-specific integrase [Brevibacterium sp.]MDN6123669.1 site-specific integrase [Brevibacterium sp.]